MNFIIFFIKIINYSDFRFRTTRSEPLSSMCYCLSNYHLIVNKHLQQVIIDSLGQTGNNDAWEVHFLCKK